MEDAHEQDLSDESGTSAIAIPTSTICLFLVLPATPLPTMRFSLQMSGKRFDEHQVEPMFSDVPWRRLRS